MLDSAAESELTLLRSEEHILQREPHAAQFFKPL
jgi:hypothetical protein